MSDRLQLPLHSASAVGLLLGAGSGSRFALSAPNVRGHKLDALIHGRSVAELALQSLANAVDSTVVVTREESVQLQELAHSYGAHCVIAADAGRGMGHSLAAGVRAVRIACPKLRVLVIALADMPWVLSSTVEALIQYTLEKNCIVQPTYLGERGNPVAFPRRYLDSLAQCHGDVGARQLMRDHAADVFLLAVDDAGVLRDVDVPADLDQSLRSHLTA